MQAESGARRERISNAPKDLPFCATEWSRGRILGWAIATHSNLHPGKPWEPWRSSNSALFRKTGLREDESFYILDGRFSVLVGSESLEAAAGAFVHIPRETLHT
jgi:hypothetical protein